MRHPRRDALSRLDDMIGNRRQLLDLEVRIIAQSSTSMSTACSTSRPRAADPPHRRPGRHAAARRPTSADDDVLGDLVEAVMRIADAFLIKLYIIWDGARQLRPRPSAW